MPRTPAVSAARNRAPRLLAAVTVSVGTHLALAGLFLLVIGHEQTTLAIEDLPPESLTVTADPANDPPRSDFLSIDSGLLNLDPGQVTTPSSRLGEDNVFGADDLLKDVGRTEGMIDPNPQRQLLTPPGFPAPDGFSGGTETSGPGNAVLGGPGGVDLDLARFVGPKLSLKDLRNGDSGGARDRLVTALGRTDQSEAAVGRGLKWLLQVQSPDGRWMLDHPTFKDRGAANDTAGTALGLLPFLGAGKTHKAPPYDKPIEKALAFLLRHQDRKTGNLGGGMYGHGLATIALCEAYGLTQDPALRRPAQLAVNYIVAAQHEAGGWRYSPGQPGDTSVTGWQVMALKSGLMAGLDVPYLTLRKAERFLDSVCSATSEGYGYVDANPTPNMTAVGLLCRQYVQSWGPQNPRLIKGIATHLQASPPGARRDAYYHYYATQVMFHYGGEAWKNWNDKMRDHLIGSQEVASNSPAFGSWSSAGDAHGAAGGRLMLTSLNLLTLEVYYRYLPLYYRETGARKDGAAQTP